MNDVQKTMVTQVAEQVFVKKVYLVDEATVRFPTGAGRSVDVSYDAGSDTYTVSCHKLNRKTYETTTETTSFVFFEDLGKFFPERLVKDENVRAFCRMVREARTA